MEYSTFTIGMKRIIANFPSKQYGAEAVKIAWEEVKSEDDCCMKPAVDKLILESSPGILPHLSKLVSNIRDIAINNREKEAKDNNANYPKINEIEPATNYGRECVKFVLELLSGEIDKQTYLKKCLGVFERHNRPFEEAAWIETQWKQIG